MEGCDEEEPKDSAQVEELKDALEAEKRRSEEFLTRLKYMQADFENLKKRFDRQVEEVRKYCSEPLIVELLGLVDELEIAVKSGRSSGSNEAIIEGVEIILKKMRKILEDEEVFPIDCIGKPFDPAKHSAVAKVERDDAGECTVIEEIRKGYIMKEKVIRPSVVKVAVKPSSKPRSEVGSNE